MTSNFELPIPYDVLAAATDRCLAGDAPGFVDCQLERQTPASVVYRLAQRDVGNLGTVTIRKLQSELSEACFSDAPFANDEEAIEYALRFRRPEFSEEWAAVLKAWLDQALAQAGESKTFDLFPGLRGDAWEEKIREFHTQRDHAQKLLHEKRKEYLSWVIQVYFGQLSNEPIWLGQPQGNAAALKVKLITPTASRDDAQDETASRALCLFVKKGEAWEITYGAKPFILPESKGLAYMIALLKNPDRDLSSTELVRLVSGQGTMGVQVTTEDYDESELEETDLDDDAEAQLDPRAKRAYQVRIEELDERIKSARARGAYKKAEGFETERDAIARELRSVTWHGKRKKFSTATDKARLAVFGAIKNARLKIKKQDKALGAYLETTIETGLYCAYRPDKMGKPIEIEFVCK